MRVEHIVRWKRVALPSRVKHFARDRGVPKLDEQRFSEAVRIAQSVGDEFDRRETSRYCASVDLSFCIGGASAEDSDVRFELDGVEISRQTTDQGGECTPQGLSWRQPEGVLLVGYLHIPLCLRHDQTPNWMLEP